MIKCKQCERISNCPYGIQDCEYIISTCDEFSFDFAEHDSELLDKVMQKWRTVIDEDGMMYKIVLLKDIEDLKAEVQKG